MKEVTYDDWQKNPTPRVMWVWDGKDVDKVKRKVIYFIENKDVSYPVVTLSYDSALACNYKYCAEIEKQRRMTNKELSRWLREKPTRDCKYLNSEYIYSTFEYKEYKQDEEVSEGMCIREDDGEWREPLVEAEE